MDNNLFHDEIFIQAAEKYPLNTQSVNWQNVKMKLYKENNPSPAFIRTSVRQNPKSENYWKRYPVHVQPEKIEKCFSSDVFTSQGKQYELLHFYKNSSATNVLISPGLGSHAYVFAELGYLIHKLGYNVFIMPRHGGYTIDQLFNRHEHAVEYITANYTGDLHLYGEGVGGLVVFYLALSGNQNIKSITCENSPAVLTDFSFHEALKNHGAAAKRIASLLPLFRIISKLAPWLPVPIKTYPDWNELIDFGNESNRQIESHIVKAYSEDPDFDRKYPLKSVMSLMSAAPPKRISTLNTPVQFIVAKRGFVPAYFENLLSQIQISNKRLVKVDGGALWMVSNPEEASVTISNWIIHQKKEFKNEQPQTCFKV